MCFDRKVNASRRIAIGGTSTCVMVVLWLKDSLPEDDAVCSTRCLRAGGGGTGI